MDQSPAIPKLPTSSNEAEGNFDLLHYWQLIWQRKFSIISLGVIFALVTAVVVSGKPNIYVSTASLLIEQNRANITTIEDLYGIDTQSRSYTSTQFELLRSRKIAERVIRSLNLLKNPEFVAQPASEATPSEPAPPSLIERILPDFISRYFETDNTNQSETASSENGAQQSEEVVLSRVIDTFSRRLRVTPVNNTSIVRVEFTATKPELAAEISNSVANAYIENDMEQRLQATQQASYWLSERVTSLNETLQDSEKNLQAYLEREQLVDVGGVTALISQEIDELSSQALEYQRERVEIEAIYRRVRQLVNPTIEELLSFPVILNHSSIQTAKQNADEIDFQIAELSNRYGRNHPRMIALMSEKEIVHSALEEQVHQLLNTIESDYQTALDNEQNTNTRLENSKSRLQDINRTSFELRELEREVNTNRQLYEMFFTRIRETQETNDFQSTNAILVDPAVPALYPSGPQRKRSVIMALILGLAFGGGLVILRDMLDSTLKNHTEIESRLHATSLGIVPLVNFSKKDKKKENAYLGFLENMQSTFTESFRTIRTSITLSSLDKPYKVISITSSVPDEGKTTVAINLSSVMGQVGRTLLIDTDLRRPSLEKSLDLPPNSPGLSNYLAGNNEISECLYSYKKAGITVMPAGHMVPNPLELLSSEKFKNLLLTFSSKFDRIILDTPPSQAVSDALILGNIADAVVFVARADSTPVKLVKSQLQRMKQADANVIGVVLNQLDTAKISDSGGYYDTYGYSAPMEADQPKS